MTTRISKQAVAVAVLACTLSGCAHNAVTHSSQASGGTAAAQQQTHAFELNKVDRQIAALQANTAVPSAVRDQLLSHLEQERSALASRQ
jgi:hypothetical protein